MDMTEKNVKAAVIAGLIAAALAVLGMYAGRTYEQHKVNTSYEEALKEKDLKIQTTTDTLAQALVEKGKLYVQLEQLKKEAKTWAKGTKTVEADGKITTTWDTGTDVTEEVVRSLNEQVEELSASLNSSNEATTKALNERDALQVQLLKSEAETKKPGEFRGLLFNWDMEGKTWHTALNTQLVMSLGTFLGSVSLRPGGPFRPSDEGKEPLARFFDLGPSVGLGLRF